MTAPKSDSDVFALSLSSFFRDHGGGVEMVAHQLAAHLAEREGWRSALAAHEHDARRDRDEDYETLSIRCWNGLERLSGLPLMIPHPGDLLRVMRVALRADVLVVHEEIYLSNLICLASALLRGRKAVVVKHTGLMRTESRLLGLIQSTVTRLFLRPLVARADAVVFVTEAKRLRYDPSGAIRSADVIENGVDCDLFAPPDTASASERPVILFVGRFVALKGLSLVRRLAETSPDWDFHLIGWGVDEPETWGLPNVRVRRRPPRVEIAAACRAADVFIFTGKSEGVPLVVLEALASGLPVVATAGCATSDADLAAAITPVSIGGEDSGDGVNAWRAAIEAVLVARGPSDAMRRRAPVLKRYSEAATLARYDRVLDKVLAQ